MVDNARTGGRSAATIVEDERTGAPPRPSSNEEVAALIDTLEQTYQFRRRDEVRAFLTAHADLVVLLDEASSKIPEFLPADEPMALEVVKDPEDEGAEGELFALVPTELAPEQVLPRLDRLRREWLIAATRGASGWFNVDVEYR